MPLSTEFIGSTRAAPQSTTLLSLDGAPAIYARPVGEGHVITVDFDLGEQLVAMQQGKPSEAMQVRRAEGANKEVPPRTKDLVMDERLLGAETPYADLLERFIIHGVILKYLPAPTLWYYPDGALGAVIATHEDSELGDRGGWMLDYETSQRSLSSLLTSVDSGLTASGAMTLHQKGGDIGLLWRMEGTPSQRFERLGVGAFKPVSRALTLKRQVTDLKATLPVSYVRTVRSMDGWWSPAWSEPFAQMAEQGLRLDLSYEVPRSSGYAFGTGLPFLVMSEHGIPYGVREMPMVYPDGVTQGAELSAMLAASQQGHHMALATAMSPSSFASYPDVERFEHWLALFEEIKQRGHVMTSAYNLDTYLRSRRASSLRSRVVRDATLPGASSLSEPPPPRGERPNHEASRPRGERAALMRVTVEAKMRGMSLLVPATLHGARFHSARLRSNRAGKEGAQASVETFEIAPIGLEKVLIPVDRGFSTVDIYYAHQSGPKP